MSKTIGKHSVVTLHIEMRDSAGNMLDSTVQRREPLVYIHGNGTLLPGLEAKLEGREVGDHVMVSLAPEKAFGQLDPTLVQVVPEGLFEGVNLKIGMMLDSQSDSYQIRTVTKIENGEVTLDANHPLAGKTLDITAEVLFIRAATEQEIAEGIL